MVLCPRTARSCLHVHSVLQLLILMRFLQCKLLPHGGEQHRMTGACVGVHEHGSSA